MVVQDFLFFCRVIRLRQPTWLNRLFRVLPSHPPHAFSRTTHYASAMHFRHLRCAGDFHSLVDCAAKRTKGPESALASRFRSLCHYSRLACLPNISAPVISCLFISNNTRASMTSNNPCSKSEPIGWLVTAAPAEAVSSFADAGIRTTDSAT